MGIFNIDLYPPPPILTYGFGSLAIPESKYIWINLLWKNRVQLMFGNLDDFKNSNFKRSHSMVVVSLSLKEMEYTQTFDNKKFKGSYKIYKKENNGSLFIKLTIKFKTIQFPTIELNGLLISFSDYRYYLGLIKKKGKE